ncbi:hypothetical protein [Yeosuana sp. AK3]
MKTIFLIVAFLVSTSFFGQKFGIKKSKTEIYKFNDNSVVVIKATGEQLLYKDLKNQKSNYVDYVLVPKTEDLEGNISSFYYMSKTDLLSKFKETNLPTHIEINRKDIFDKVFNIQKLEGKRVLVILQIDLQLPIININSIKEAENSALKRSDCISVILTSSNKEQSIKFAIEHDLKSIIIPNASLTIEQFNQKRFPAYIILNKDKSVNTVLKYSYEVEDIFKNFD